jgi:hypothetical protein
LGSVAAAAVFTVSMNITGNRRKSVTAAVGAFATGVAAAVLLTLGAGMSHATEFDPQPEPPGQSRGFNPQPEPPTRHIGNLGSVAGAQPAVGVERVTIGH